MVTTGVHGAEMALCGLLADADLSDNDPRRRKPQRGGLKERMRRAKKEAREAREAVLGDAPFGTGRASFWPGAPRPGWRAPSAANAEFAPHVLVGRAVMTTAQQHTPSPFMPTQLQQPPTLPLQPQQPQHALLSVPTAPPPLHAPWPAQTPPPVQMAHGSQPVQAPWQMRVARREAWEAQAAAEARAASHAMTGVGAVAIPPAPPAPAPAVGGSGSAVGMSCWSGLPACWEEPQASSTPSLRLPPSEVLSCWSNVACASPAPAASASVASAALSAPPLAAAVPSAKGSASGFDKDDTPDSVMALEMIRSYMAANNLSAPVNGAFQPAS